MSQATRLPVLRDQLHALQTCVYCPKLCRTTCPVSRAEPSEVLTPWGKMSLGFELTRTDGQVRTEDARPVWGCTGCGACTAACRHKNPVESTLYSARADAVSRGAEAPGHANELGLADRLTAIGAALAERPALDRGETALKNNLGDPNAPTALLLGCAYLKDRELLAAVVKVAEHLLGSVRILNACCGAPWLHRGRAEEARQAGRDLSQKLRGAQQLIVADPGCMVTLGASTGLASRLLLDVAAENRERFSRLPASSPGPLYRWHDPCQLGRGLGRYTEPRLLLEQLNGARPLEFTASGEDAVCSGAGGALPRTLPRISADIADARIADHSALGGGTIVTACGSSLRRFQSRGASAVDLHQLLARALPGHG